MHRQKCQVTIKVNNKAFQFKIIQKEFQMPRIIFTVINDDLNFKMHDDDITKSSQSKINSSINNKLNSSRNGSYKRNITLKSMMSLKKGH